MIVKIQIPISTNTEPLALMYDETEKYQEYLKISAELKSWMRNRFKAFFEVERTPQGLKIIREVEWQAW